MDLFLPERMPEEYRTEAVSVSALFTPSFCLCLPPVLWIRIMLVNNFVVDRYGNTREKSLFSLQSTENQLSTMHLSVEDYFPDILFFSHVLGI